jgi:UDP-N-acetylglucosamine 1-carboxyvinyltransferase
MNALNMNRELAKKIRASILLLAPLLARLGFVELPYPGGCNIGKRPIDEHINGFVGLGYKDSTNDEFVVLAGKPST